MIKVNSVVIAIWSISALTALPGLAISPILGNLQTIFPQAGEMEIQMLTSLPSLLILPFILLSGYLTQKVSVYKLLIGGLIIFGATGILYLLSTQMWQLILVSAMLGIGAGIVIPLSTGLISLFFAGKDRTKQFGLNSAISNLTVVMATFFTGYLAGISWRLPFIVYLLPFIAIFLAVPLKKHWPVLNNNEDESMINESGIIIGKRGLDIKNLGNIMALYFTVTFSVVIFIFYVPFVISANGLSDKLAGIIISVFFLAIMFPGLILNKITFIFGKQTILISIFMIVIGLFTISVAHGALIMVIAAFITGIGYGVIQPLCYDKTSYISKPNRNTIALACIMSMNYLAIVLCPIIIDSLKVLLYISGNIFPFRLGMSIALIVLSLALFKNKSFVFSVIK
ncbi:MAG: MFS transporter [Bacteroidales bacterium]